MTSGEQIRTGCGALGCSFLLGMVGFMLFLGMASAQMRGMAGPEEPPFGVMMLVAPLGFASTALFWIGVLMVASGAAKSNDGGWATSWLTFGSGKVGPRARRTEGGQLECPRCHCLNEPDAKVCYDCMEELRR